MSIPQYRQDLMRIKYLISLCEQTEGEVQGHLSKHICVLASGMIENTVRECLTRFAYKRSEFNVQRYVESSLEGFQNPKWENITKLIGRFDEEWPEQLFQKIGEPAKDAINSVVANRHNIAHGRQGGPSLAVMKNYFKEIERFLNALEDLTQ